MAIYDLSRNPPTFNVVDFLMQAERWRIAQGLERIVVKVRPGPNEGFRQDTLPPYGGAERRRWLNNIVLPAPMLLPSCGQYAELVSRDHMVDGPSFGRDAYTVGPKTWRKAFAEGEYVLRAPLVPFARGKPYVTITLRNTGWWTERSADFAQWHLIGAALQDAGYHVVVVPDGAKPEETLDGFETDVTAAHRILLRASLYAGAQLNLGVSNGPLWMCWFMGAPVLICKMINENEPSAGAATFRNAMGVEPGTQPPHALARQRLVWEPDRADVIVRHALDMLAVPLERAA